MERNVFRIYSLRSGGVIVFRPFGRYVKFSNMELAVETLTRTLADEVPKFDVNTLGETAIVYMDAAA
jgi:hypothetical protein